VVDAVADGRTGLLVDGHDVEEVAGAAARLLNDRPLAESMGRAGRRRVCEELTWERSAERVAELLGALPPRRGRRRDGTSPCRR
jgi:phosphatidylinositol alpha-1,6-mannosyltransferase